MLSLTNCVLPTQYDASLQLDHLKANFRGSLRVHLKVQNGIQEVREFSLHGQNIIVLSAHIGSHKLAVSYNREQKLITFKSETPIGVSDGVIQPLVMDYVGTIHTIKTYKDATTGVFKTNYMDNETGSSDNYVVATHAQPGFARMILPCIDEVNHKAQFKVDITTHERFVVISNTAAVKEVPIPESKQKLVQFDLTPLMTPSLFGFVLGDLQCIETRVTLPQGDIPIRFFAPQQIENATFGLDTVRDMLPAVQNMFKLDFPIGKLDFALLPFLSDMAMENFALITIQQDHLLLTPSALAESSSRLRVQQLVVHELVHQWMGNYISFDSWDHLWFNEAFATWCACEVLSDVTGDDYWSSEDYLFQLDTCLKGDSSPDAQSIAKSSKTESILHTADAVDPQNYAKGISLLRSLQCSIGKDNFKAALQKFTCQPDYHNRGIKPTEIWTFFGKQLRSANIANYMFSWVQTPGFPVLHVTQENGETKIVQHRFKSSANDEFEDVPFHIPLFSKLPDGSIDQEQALLTDRSMTLRFPIVLFNSDVQGYYRVSYESLSCYDHIAEAAQKGVLSELDFYGIIRDLGEFIGNGIYQKQEHLDGLIKLLETIATRVDLKKYPQYMLGLGLGLKTLQQVEVSIMRYSDNNKKYDFNSSVYSPLFRQIEWPDDFIGNNGEKYDLELISQVLSSGKRLVEVQSICNKYFRKILQGPTNAIPIELVGSIFTVVAYHYESVKDWKKLFELSRSAQGLASHVVGGTVKDIQNAALETLGFSRTTGLVQKVLNFVLTNIDMTGCERALFGMSFNAKELCGKKSVRDLTWEWFNLHYDQWARSSLREGTQAGARMRNTLMAISVIVFEMWVDSPEKIDTFVTMKQSLFGKKLMIQEVWASVKDSQYSKMKIYEGILGF